MGICKSKEPQQPELIIRTVTWQRDSHGLFDYEGKEIDKKQMKALGSFSIMRNDTNVEVKYSDDIHSEESKEEEVKQTLISRVVEKNGGYWIFHSSTVDETDEDLEKNPETKLWRIIKYCKARNGGVDGYKIMPEDLVKLGRVRFKVRDIQSASYKKLQVRMKQKLDKYLDINRKSKPRRKNSQELTDTDQIHNDNQDPFNGVLPAATTGDSKTVIVQPHEDTQTLVIRDPSAGSNGVPLCRICLSEDYETMNPLFSPCKCAGTMKYIHLNCLQEWLSSKKQTKETSHTKTYYWKSLDCELCKTPFPNHIRSGDKSVFLRVIQYELPQANPGEDQQYMVLESVSNNTSKVIHVINFAATEEIRMGRGHDADVRITDISVSRVHALIKKSPKGYFYIEDNNSKFGTLALIKHPFLLSFNESNFFQAGRTQVEITIRRPLKLFNSCLCTQTTITKRNSSIRGGLATKNGIHYFPEEFLPEFAFLKNTQSMKLDFEPKGDKQQHMATAFHSEAHLDENNVLSPGRNMSNTQKIVDIHKGLASMQPPLNRLHSNQFEIRDHILEELKEEERSFKNEYEIKRKQKQNKDSKEKKRKSKSKKRQVQDQQEEEKIFVSNPNLQNNINEVDRQLTLNNLVNQKHLTQEEDHKHSRHSSDQQRSSGKKQKKRGSIEDLTGSVIKNAQFIDMFQQQVLGQQLQTGLNESTKGPLFVKNYLEEDPNKTDIIKLSKIAGIDSNLPTGRGDRSSKKAKISARRIDDKTYIEDEKYQDTSIKKTMDMRLDSQVQEEQEDEDAKSVSDQFFQKRPQQASDDRMASPDGMNSERMLIVDNFTQRHQDQNQPIDSKVEDFQEAINDLKMTKRSLQKRDLLNLSSQDHPPGAFVNYQKAVADVQNNRTEERIKEENFYNSLPNFVAEEANNNDYQL